LITRSSQLPEINEFIPDFTVSAVKLRPPSPVVYARSDRNWGSGSVLVDFQQTRLKMKFELRRNFRPNRQMNAATFYKVSPLGGLIFLADRRT
jgi:hypothetical protein